MGEGYGEARGVHGWIEQGMRSISPTIGFRNDASSALPVCLFSV
jgi:hypothetical protein